MLTDLKKYENLGTPQYFFELFNTLKNEGTSAWKRRDVEQLYYNKIINDRSVFDGCIFLALEIKILNIDENDIITLDENIKDFLFSEKQMCDKFVEFLFTALNQDDIFHAIFSSEHISYDIIYHSTQINNSAFGFKFSNFKQILIDFDVIQIHPVQEFKKYILNSRYKKIFDKIILPEIKKRKLGVDDLKKILEQQQIHGEEAEKFVLNFEKKRLNDKVGINWVAEYSVAEGYDIASFQNEESIINDMFIEVKSYVGKPYFFWSRNEIEVSRRRGENYFLYLVDRDKILDKSYEPLMIPNPFVNVLDNDDWAKQVEKYKIELST